MLPGGSKRNIQETLCTIRPNKLIYKFLNSKYAFNRKMGRNDSDSVFSTRIIFSTELAMNALSIVALFFMDYPKLELTSQNYIIVIIISFLLPLILTFKILKYDKIVNTKSNKNWRVISICYSIATYIIFFYLIVKLKNNV
jgi:hypothetical protein